MTGTLDRVRMLARRTVAVFAATCAVLGTFGHRAHADEAVTAPTGKVRVIEFEGAIEPSLAAYLKRSFAAARADGVTAIVLAIDSPGGRVDSMLEIADALLALPKSIRTTAWIEHEAISAAAFSALACDEIVMAPHATIGDCQPIIMGGEAGIVPAGEKIETYLRAQFRRLARMKGWDPVLVEKFVTKDRSVIEVEVIGTSKTHYVFGDEFDSARDQDQIAGHAKKDLRRLSVAVPTGQLLTLTTSEAQRLGFVTRVFADTKAFEASLLVGGATLDHVTMSTSELAGRWLLGIAGVLSGIIMLCVVMTLYQGIGTPAIVGVVALTLLGLVTATAELSNGLALFLAGLGVLLLLAEAFFIPGFTIAGLLGIVAMGAGFLFLATGTSFSHRGNLSFETAKSFLLQTILAIGATAAVFYALARALPRLPFGGRTLVAGAQGLTAFAQAAPSRAALVTGMRGLASTDLRPAGHASFDGRGAPTVDVVSEGEFIDAGTALEVVRVEGHRVVVRPSGKARTP